MTEWQPIETAPRTGEYLLLGSSVHEAVIYGRWSWQTRCNGCWVMGRKRIEGTLTHWMPLPTPPKG